MENLIWSTQAVDKIHFSSFIFGLRVDQQQNCKRLDTNGFRVDHSWRQILVLDYTLDETGERHLAADKTVPNIIVQKQKLYILPYLTLTHKC